jgi:hypothetical protein
VLAAILWAAAAAGSAAAGAAALAVSGVVIFTVFVTGYQVRESRHLAVPPGRCRRGQRADRRFLARHLCLSGHLAK